MVFWPFKCLVSIAWFVIFGGPCCNTIPAVGFQKKNWYLMRLQLFFAILFSLLIAAPSQAQDSLRFYRLYLKDKGTPFRYLSPGDLLYPEATRHLTPRALQRRAKVLPPDQLVSTDDLPIYQPYLDAIAATGAEIAQKSRWLNTVMIRTDSATHQKLLALPFLDSIRTARTVTPAQNPFGKTTAQTHDDEPHTETGNCIPDQYGLATIQNFVMGFDKAHQMGIAGEGVLVGVMDGGFDWRNHLALRGANVIGEYDFVYGDSTTYDLPGETNSESHGTIVASTIAGYLPGKFIGGAPRATFLLARTEDIRRERNIEEDHYVAGLEWLESQGVDITNASLGYTTFDAPEQNHTYAELDGKTAIASRGINKAATLGVLCINAAGNDGANSWRYVGVPAEADSAVAVAAVDSAGRIANFSSRGLRGRGLKPDVAAMGVKVFGADASDTARITSAQGTSLASPLATAAAALILSARPDLKPWEIRQLLTTTADHADKPDTAYGYGLINVGRALLKLSQTKAFVGFPKASVSGERLTVIAWVSTPRTATATATAETITLEATNVATGTQWSASATAPYSGIVQWTIDPATLTNAEQGDSIRLRFTIGGEELRRSALRVWSGSSKPESFLCEGISPTSTLITSAAPNPLRGGTTISFSTESDSHVTLRVFNALGQQVATLIDADLPAGRHTALFNPAGLPVGAYHYFLIAGGKSSSESLIYTR